jgi:hypothetical protein
LKDQGMNAVGTRAGRGMRVLYTRRLKRCCKVVDLATLVPSSVPDYMIRVVPGVIVLVSHWPFSHQIAGLGLVALDALYTYPYLSFLSPLVIPLISCCRSFHMFVGVLGRLSVFSGTQPHHLFHT